MASSSIKTSPCHKAHITLNWLLKGNYLTLLYWPPHSQCSGTGDLYYGFVADKFSTSDWCCDAWQYGPKSLDVSESLLNVYH